MEFLHSRIPHAPKLDTRYQIARDLIFPALLFPMVIFMQAALERKLRIAAVLRHPIVAWMGNLSYSLYLWHYPLMIALAVGAAYAGASPFLFYSPAVFCLYLIILTLLSHLSYHRFERPMMHAIRGRFRRGHPQAFPASVSDIATAVAVKSTTL